MSNGATKARATSIGGRSPRVKISRFSALPHDRSVYLVQGAQAERLPGLLRERDGPSALVAGDARTILASFPSGSCQTCVTSPPYWSLRDYGIPGQIGLEPSVREYISDLAGVFDEVHRILRDDGTLWLNIGASYTSGGRTWRAPDRKNPVRAMSVRPPTPEGLKPKDLIGVPWRLAFALQDRGWYLRADVIWNKPNCQPESVKDRPTRSHEYLFLLTKAEKYYYDAAAIAVPFADEHMGNLGGGGHYSRELHAGTERPNGKSRLQKGRWNEKGSRTFRNRRSVWTIATQPMIDWSYDFSGADYVDGHGTPRRWSPDCPVHERDGRPRQESSGSVSCDGPRADPPPSSERSDAGLAGGPFSGSAPTRGCSRRLATDIPNDGPRGSIPESRIFACSREGVLQRSSGSQRTPIGASPSMMDSLILSCSPTATSSSKKNRKRRPCAWGVEADMADESVGDRSLNMSPSEHVEACSTLVNKTAASIRDSSSLGLSFGISGSESRRSWSKDKCECSVIQVSHSATFRQTLVEPCILAGSRPGDLALGPFIGAGTTGLAALNMGRRFFGAELNPRYVDIARRRLGG